MTSDLVKGNALFYRGLRLGCGLATFYTRDRGSVARASTGAEIGNLLSRLKHWGNGGHIGETRDMAVDLFDILS